MNWISLTSEAQLESIDKESSIVPAVLIFKHSTRCSISSMALSRFERNWDNAELKTPTYLLDLITYRELSNVIAERYHVTHESPQVLLIRNGKCISHISHNQITVDWAKSSLTNL